MTPTARMTRALRWSLVGLFFVCGYFPGLLAFFISLGECDWWFRWGERLQDWADRPQAASLREGD